MADSNRNVAEYSVSEISTAVKKTVEDAFGYVRIRGEISGFRGVHSSGHCYFSLKDDRARIEAVIWRSTLQRLKFRPEEGIEVVATGRVTTFAGQSKYQIVIEALEPAGAGALMALLDARRKKLAAEGLFAENRKAPLPYLPRVIGVVTSPTGAVIRDILHRLDDRFPTRVILWPVRVQGEASAPEVTAAVRGFNALDADGAIPRPDVLIVARGGGSLEDLWGFNDEDLVRAVAASSIPVISAVGHETDITLIDHAADRRAPTPTAAAEMAVPVRSELVSAVRDLEGRLDAAAARGVETLRREVAALTRALPRVDDLVGQQRRSLDNLAGRVGLALQANTRAHGAAYERAAAKLSLPGLRRVVDGHANGVRSVGQRLDVALRAHVRHRRSDFDRIAATLSVSGFHDLVVLMDRALGAATGQMERAMSRLGQRRSERLDAQTKLLEAVSYRSVLERGFALVTDDSGEPVRSARHAPSGKVLGIRFHDGEVTAVSGGTSEPRRRRPKPDSDTSQGSLL